MIYRSRSMNLIPQKSATVRDVCVRAAAYVCEHYPGVHVEILENIAGARGQIHMVARCDSLAALEAYEVQRLDDPSWMALAEEVGAIEGIAETVDNLYRIVS